MITCIVAASANDVIGVDNQLPWRLSTDLKRFKELTLNSTVVMGRRTFDSILAITKGPEILPNRTKYVITNTLLPRMENTTAIFVTDPDKFVSRLEQKHETIHVIGGAKIYEMFKARYDVIHLTRVHVEISEDLQTVLPPDFLVGYKRDSIVSNLIDQNNNNYNYDFEIWTRNLHAQSIAP